VKQLVRGWALAFLAIYLSISSAALAHLPAPLRPEGLARTTVAAQFAPPTGVAHWLNTEAIQLIAHHTSAVIAAILLFSLVGWLVRKLLHDSFMKRLVLILDEVILFCILAYFAYELLFLLCLRIRTLPTPAG
jgi:uncharacterized membrane protein YGL010W